MAKKQIKQTELFGMDVDGRDSLLMQDVSSSQEYRKMMAELSNLYTMDVLELIVGSFRKIFKKYKICDSDNPAKGIPCMAKLTGGLKYKKDYLALCANIFTSQYNFQLYFSMLDEETMNMWNYLFLHVYASGDQLEQATGVRWVAKKASRYSYYGDAPTVCNNDGWPISVSSGGYYYSSERYLYLNSLMWHLYQTTVFPVLYEKRLNSEGIDMLPDGLQTYTNEFNVGMQMSVIRQLLSQNAIEFSLKKMTASMVKKVAKQLTFPEFYPDTKEKEQKQLAASLAIPVLSAYLSNHPESDLNNWPAVIKDFFNKCSMRYAIFDMLSHLSGLSRDEVLHDAKYDHLDRVLQAALGTMKSGRWYDVRDVVLRMYQVKEVDTKWLTVISPAMLERRTIYNNNKHVTTSDLYDYVEWPMIFGYLALYTSCGLVEAAYNDEHGIGSYSFIKYIRLTKLGEYVLGLSATYKAEGMHMPSEYFETDDAHLIIRSILIDGKNPYEGIITRIAERISENRYRVTPATFLNGCSSMTDLQQKEQFFRDNICKEPSAIWTQFFQQMKQRCNPLMPTAEQYSVRQVNAANRELLQLFATDSYLRKHTLRGENFTIMIETRFMAKVEEKLRSYGYLI